MPLQVAPNPLITAAISINFKTFINNPGGCANKNPAYVLARTVIVIHGPANFIPPRWILPTLVCPSRVHFEYANRVAIRDLFRPVDAFLVGCFGAGSGVITVEAILDG